jgi:hypothetical protein
MKTAISIDEQLFFAAENFSRFTGLSRSGLYCTALSEYIQNHSSDIVTEKLNNYYDSHDSCVDNGLKMAAHNLLSKEDW